MRWLGPGIVIGHEGVVNVWAQHHNAVDKKQLEIMFVWREWRKTFFGT